MVWWALLPCLLALSVQASASTPRLDNVRWDISAEGSVCPYDPVDVAVTWTAWSDHDTSPAHVVLVSVGDGIEFVVADSQVQLKPTQVVHDAVSVFQDDSNVLTCELDVASCTPKVVTLVLPNRPGGVLMAGDVLKVEFDGATNTPRVASKADLDAILEFPIHVGDDMEGTWVTMSILHIRIASISTNVSIANITQTPTVRTRPQVLRQRTFESPSTAFRIAVPGLYAWRLVLANGLTRVDMDSPRVMVSTNCAPAKVVSIVVSEDMADPQPAPSFQVRGMVALDGVHALHVPNSSVPRTWSWSLVFWVYLSQDATGTHRTLFYKGPGHNQHRTPSAWLQPDDRRVILRVSAEDNMDVGMTSKTALPLHEWVLVGFAFRNHSADRSQTGGNKTFAYVYTVNGNVDTEMNVHNSVVLDNDGGLYLGGNPWMDGMRGFMQNIRLYTTALTVHQIQTMFQQEHGNLLSLKTTAGQLTALLRHQANTVATAPPSNVATSLVNSMEAHDEAAVLGHPSSLYRMGEAYLYGTDDLYKPNATLAAWYFKQALHGGEAAAAKPLALIYATDPSTLGEAIALFHYAASMGDASSNMILARRYEKGDGVEADGETAAHYYYIAAVDASRAYHTRGNQPLHEMNSLFHADQVNVAEGQEGENDKWIQFQKMRADHDQDVDAMVAMGDLYYWGARGCARDHPLAFEYFERAATLGSPIGMSAAAGMLLKGEGVAQDNETAIRWYEQAAMSNNVRALNGLGYIHFYGTANCTQNQSKGLEFFEHAAAQRTDGDSLFNAGYCHFVGLGTPANTTRALAYFRDAAHSFGHFDSIFELGKVALNVDGTFERHVSEAITYLRAVSAAGDWGKVARQGFDAYLSGQHHQAIWLYHEAREYGYPVAAGNLAYLYDAMGLPNSATYLAEATEVEASLRLGDCYYYGKCGVGQNVHMALIWYSRASADGLSVGAYNVGYMNEYGIGGIPVNGDRATRYYKRALELSPSWETWFVMTVSIYRVQLRSRYGLTASATTSSSFVPASTPPAIDWNNVGLGVVVLGLVGMISVQFLRR
ncbi:hypothetical protein H310_09012 [Aphanomyces invadans]|uniref:LamG-like jellyroll fold domain-containing protein n=1 Tax=Aphanomyces invadans TaxID=157072 RepID=A0A024TVY4_9STRA|nr:hypothetical protein H310_09012 [Aphanomyces invadans]ETV98310.1 hypothetical protein H310_09012 [Aphanomyces invadans]|eukprot:XP_008873185.1 hypothetical protein H310_09012 [Aphanomyces invadans]